MSKGLKYTPDSLYAAVIEYRGDFKAVDKMRPIVDYLHAYGDPMLHEYALNHKHIGIDNVAGFARLKRKHQRRFCHWIIDQNAKHINKESIQLWWTDTITKKCYRDNDGLEAMKITPTLKELDAEREIKNQ